jgi:ABC-type transporter Mla subunit MlaD
VTPARAVAVLALLAAALPAGCASSVTTPAIRPYEIEAAFEKLPQAVGPGTQVRVSGVVVGAVTKVDRPPPGVVVRMTIRRNLFAIHQNATILVRPRIFLEGHFFLDLSPGTPSSPLLARDARLPATQTGYRGLP